MVLSKIHSKSIIHGDIKPQNILYDTKSERLKVIDFGFSVCSCCCKKKPKKIVNKYFKAPELIFSSDDNYSTEIDIWAVGMIFLSILTQKFPFFCT